MRPAKDCLLYRSLPRFAGFFISDLSKSRKPAISFPLFHSYPVAFFFISSCHRVLLSCEIRRYHFERTLRALLRQRLNRKSQLLQASPFAFKLCLFLQVSLGVFFNCAQCSRCSCSPFHLAFSVSAITIDPITSVMRNTRDDVFSWPKFKVAPKMRKFIFRYEKCYIIIAIYQ